MVTSLFAITAICSKAIPPRSRKHQFKSDLSGNSMQGTMDNFGPQNDGTFFEQMKLQPNARGFGLLSVSGIHRWILRAALVSQYASHNASVFFRHDAQLIQTKGGSAPWLLAVKPGFGVLTPVSFSLLFFLLLKHYTSNEIISILILLSFYDARDFHSNSESRIRI